MKLRYLVIYGLIWALAIILLFGMVGGAQGAGMRQGEATSPVQVGHEDVALFETIPAEYLTAARDMTMIYTDKSVGSNLSDGLTCLATPHEGAADNCKRYIHRDPAYNTTPEDVYWPGVYPRWNWYFELCTDPICTIAAQTRTGAQVFALFPSYQERYPDVESAFAPLLAHQASSGARLVILTSSLSRGTDGDGENMRFLETQNAEIRAWAARHAVPLLDAADILSHTPAGEECYDARDGVLYYVSETQWENFPDDGVDTPAICPHYTTEVSGGHLGNVSAGKIRLAKAWWVMIAQLAGWQPEPVIPETPTTAPPTATATAVPPDADICRATVDLSGYPADPLERNPYMELRAYGADLTPRDAAGNPAPGGKLGAVMIGHSTTQHICSEFRRTLYAPGEPSLLWVCGAQAGEGTADHWADPANGVWAELAVRVAAEGLTPAQVQVAIVKLAYIGAVEPGGEEAYVARLAADLLATERNLEAVYPNLQVVYYMPLIARHTQATADVTSNEPAGYLSRQAVQRFINDYFTNTRGIKALLPGGDLWAADWPADYYRGDCVHLTDAGQVYAAQQFKDWLVHDDTAFWYEGLGAVQLTPWPATVTPEPPTVTPEPTVEPTVTSVPPTVTPEPTLPPTVEPTVAPPPTATVTPEPGGDFPPCPNHHRSVWHEVYDAAQGCYYDHFHGDNPHDMDGVFGTEFRTAVMHAGSDVSPLSDPLPLDYDHHVGMVWLNKTGECDTTNSAGCIVEARVAVHHFPHPRDVAESPWHTGYIEARLCAPDGRCGTYRTLGYQYGGDIRVDNVMAVDRPDPREFLINPITGQANKTAYPVTLLGCNTGNGGAYQTWYMVSPQNWRVATLQNNVWQNACELIGQPATAKGDGSVYELHTIGVDFPLTMWKHFDPDGNGIIDHYRGYVTPQGLIDQTCTAISAACLPLWIDGVPLIRGEAGKSQYQGVGNGNGRVEVDYNPDGAPLYNPFESETDAPACAVDQAQGQPIESSTHFGLWAGVDSVAQTFQPSTDGELCSATLSLYDVRTNADAAPASAYVEVWSDGGGQPSERLATSENAVLATDMTGMCEPLSYTFAPGVQLVGGNTYWLLAKSDLNTPDWFFDACWTSGAEDLYPGGAFWAHKDGVWAAFASDTGAYVDAAFSVSSRAGAP